MSTLTLPLTYTPAYLLLALSLFHNAKISWDTESGDEGEPSYGDIIGAEKVRAELEKGIPGKEVSFQLQPCLVLIAGIVEDTFTPSADSV